MYAAKRGRAPASAGMAPPRPRRRRWGPRQERERVSAVPLRERHAGRGPAGAREPGASGRAERVGDLLPRLAPRECLRQVQDNAPDGALDPDGDLQQSLAQRRDLGGTDGRSARVGLQHLAQDIGRRGEQQTELVGPRPS